MRVTTNYPPNYDAITAAFPKVLEHPEACFTHGEIIHNPQGAELTPDFIYHEEIHARQQFKLGVKKWWDQWIADPDFRLAEELAAFRAQYQFGKSRLRAKQLKILLHICATNLSHEVYGGMVSYSEAATLIRHNDA